VYSYTSNYMLVIKRYRSVYIQFKSIYIYSLVNSSFMSVQITSTYLIDCKRYFYMIIYDAYMLTYC